MTDAPGAPEEGPRRLSPLAAMRRHWKASAGLIAVGLVAGIAYGAAQSPTYQAMARVGVGSGTTGQNEVGFIEIALEQVADNDARIVTTNNFVPKLPASVGNPAGVSSITASTIPNSAIIEIDVAASDPSTAVKTAAYVEQQFVAQVNATANYATPQSVLAQLTPLTAQQVAATNALADAQSALTALKATPGATAAAIAAQQSVVNADQTKVTLLNTQVSALNAEYSSLLSNPQPASTLHQVTGAVSAGSNKTSLIERYALLGLAVGALLALGVAIGRDSRRVLRERAALAAGAPLAAVSDLRPETAVGESLRAEVRRNRTRGGRPERTPVEAGVGAGAEASSAGASSAGASSAGASSDAMSSGAAAEAADGPDTAVDATADPVDPYLAQALRTSLQTQREGAQARLDAEAEAHRREVRDALQRLSRASGEAEPVTDSGLFYPPSPPAHDEAGEADVGVADADVADEVADDEVADDEVADDEVADEVEVVELEPADDVSTDDEVAAEIEGAGVEVPAQGGQHAGEEPMADVRPLFGPRGSSRRIRVLPASDEPARDGLPADAPVVEDEPFPIFDLDGIDGGEPHGERPGSDDGRRGRGH